MTPTEASAHERIWSAADQEFNLVRHSPFHVQELDMAEEDHLVTNDPAGVRELHVPP